MFRRIDVQYFPAVVTDNDHGVQQPKRQRNDDKHVHRCGIPHMVSEKFLPSRIASYSVFIKFSHKRSSDRSAIHVIAKLQQFGTDAR
jgi:hypothetical protein